MMTEKRDWGGWVEATSPPDPIERVACPLCGTPLDIKDGVLHCPFDGWEGKEGDTA